MHCNVLFGSLSKCLAEVKARSHIRTLGSNTICLPFQSTVIFSKFADVQCTVFVLPSSVSACWESVEQMIQIQTCPMKLKLCTIPDDNTKGKCKKNNNRGLFLTVSTSRIYLLLELPSVCSFSVALFFTNVNLDEEKKERNNMSTYSYSCLMTTITPTVRLLHTVRHLVCFSYLPFRWISLPAFSLSHLHSSLTWPFTLLDFSILCQLPPGEIISHKCFAPFSHLNVITMFSRCPILPLCS